MKVTVIFGLMWGEPGLRHRHPEKIYPMKVKKTQFFVGWSEARSPTAVADYAPNVGLRASLQPTKAFYLTARL